MRLPFNIEDAKMAIMAGTGRVITADGQPVKILKWDDLDRKNLAYPVYGQVGNTNMRLHWTENGVLFSDHEKTGPFCLDLVIETIGIDL